ncbi:MAG: tRNA (adenosine(37)-N6)-dimethylallyltransferase MiaA, partial [Acidimicrobiales bacterium]
MLPRPPPAQTVGDQGHIARFALVGPTATGKSALALALARARGDVELISADSMCVYRGMDIGTAKPGPEDQRAGRYHLIDVVEANEDYSVRRFQTAARDAMAEIEGRGHVVVVVGGTGLYTRAVVDDFEIPGRWPEVATSLRRQLEEGGSRAGALLYQRLAELDPTAASRLEASNTRRLVRALEVTLGSGRPFSSFGPGMVAYPSTGFTIIGIDLPDEVLDARIRARFEHQMDRGFVAETAALIDRAGGLSA